MLRRVRRLVEELHLELMDAEGSLVVRQGDRLVAIPKHQIQARLDDGSLTPETPVLDLSLYSLADLWAGRLEGPLAGTWVGRKFKVATDA